MANQVKRQSLTEQVDQAIVDLINERGLRPGDALPSTSELASTFDVSVPIIREALAGLSAIGLLQKQQGRETVVSAPGSTHLSRVLGLRVASADVDDVGLQQYREIVEVGNARLAAANRTDRQLDELDAALRVLGEVTEEAELHEADVAFHAAIARAGGNDLMIVTLDAIVPLLRRQRQRVWRGWVSLGGGLEPIIDAHGAILEAVRAGDEDSAAAAMSYHLAQARRGLDATPAEAPS